MTNYQSDDCVSFCRHENPRTHGAPGLTLNDQLFTLKLELKDDFLSNIELAEEDVGYGEQRDGTY